MPALSLSLSKPFKNVLLSRRIQNFFKRELFRVSVGLNFVWSLSTHHTHETQKKKGRDFFPFRERGGRSILEKFKGAAEQATRRARSPFFFARCFLWSTALFLGAKGRRREREREIFRLSHVEKDTFFLLREIFSRY
jgi:hypothetical protein